ncbi:unnamed protein product, partial [marine sediment metagenome]
MLDYTQLMFTGVDTLYHCMVYCYMGGEMKDIKPEDFNKRVILEDMDTLTLHRQSVKLHPQELDTFYLTDFNSLFIVK